MATCNADHPMELEETVIALGIGFRKIATGSDILAAVDNGMAEFRLNRRDLSVIATSGRKRGFEALAEVARELRTDIRYFDDNVLRDNENRVLTRSRRSLDVTGCSCVSEAAALAAAGSDSRLIAARSVHGPVTCAIAIGDGE